MIGFTRALLFIIGLLGLFPMLATGGEFVGSMSCASATCHGNVVGRGTAWNHSFSRSQTDDPHVKAGLVLYEPLSRQIVEALVRNAAKDPKVYDSVLRERCAGCHLTVTPSDTASSGRLDPVKVSEGVSCESCHGAASSWLEQHVAVSWKGPERFAAQTGMLDTESLLSRAEGCVRCHVGSRTADGLVRDMNHDLIAAGHPALRFDMLEYHEDMPHHWDDKGAVEKQFSESPYRVRSVGRMVGLAAAAKLSGERAQQSLANENNKSNSTSGAGKNVGHANNVPWPELADFDCFACHQTLTIRSFRLPNSVDGKPALHISNGLPLWNAWYTAPLAATEGSNVWTLRPKPGGQAKWIETAKELADLYHEKAVTQANSPAPVAPFAAVRQQLNRRAPSDWHAAAVMYLEMDAAARELMLRPDSKELGQRAAIILKDKVFPLLQFGIDDSSNGRTMTSNSPGNFDPRKFRDTTLNALNSTTEVQP